MPSSGEPPLPVYDTTGPYTDPDVTIDVEQGLARARIDWVKERGGVEEYEGRPIQPVDNGNVSAASTSRARSRRRTSRCARSTASRSRSSNGRARASSPRR